MRGGCGEERVAPRREEGEVEVGDVAEGGWEEVEVTRVAAEREGRARATLQVAEAPAHLRQRVARARVRHGGEHVRQDLLRQVAHHGFAFSGHRHCFFLFGFCEN